MKTHLQLPVLTHTIALTTLLQTQCASAGGVDRIGSRMQEYTAQKQIAGAVTLVAHGGRAVHLEATGLADIEAQTKMTANTLFAVASMTKPIVAAAVMILQDEGRLKVKDLAAKHIPAFENATLEDGKPARGLTIRALLTHTSGLHGSQHCADSLEATVQKLAEQKLRFEPGTRWQYSPGLNVCGRIIEVVSEQPLDAFLSTRIFKPLGMRDTTFLPTPEQRKRLAVIYAPGKKRKGLKRTKHWFEDYPVDVKAVPNPSGGLFSTAADMAVFYQMILNGGEWKGKRIVTAEAVEQMLTLQTGDLSTGFTPGNGWGLGNSDASSIRREFQQLAVDAYDR